MKDLGYGPKEYGRSRHRCTADSTSFEEEEILFKLLAFSYAITCKSEESSRRKSLPVLYTPSVGPSRLRILSLLIHKEEQWFESLHERRTEVRNCDLIPFDDFQKGLRTISRIHSSYQDEP